MPSERMVYLTKVEGMHRRSNGVCAVLCGFRVPLQNEPMKKRQKIRIKIFRKHFLISWFNKKTAKALTEVEERLKAESEARAKAEEMLRAELKARDTMEQEIKAEAEKMLFTQYRRYGVWEDRIKAQTRRKIAANKAQAEENIRSYAESLAQAEEKLAKAQKQAKAEATARTAAEEMVRSYATALTQAEEKLADLQGQAKTEDTTKAEEELAKAQEQIKTEATARAAAEEKVRSYTTALAQAEEKLAKIQEQAKIEAVTRAMTESLKAESEKQNNAESQGTETFRTFKRIILGSSPSGVKKRKYALISLLAISVILTAIAFGVRVTNNPPVAEPGSVTTQEDKTVSISLMGTDPDRDQLTYNVVKDPSYGRLSGTAQNLTYRPNKNFNGPDSFTFKVNDGIANSDKAMISITVLSADDAPEAYSQSKTTKVNKSMAAILTGSDIDGDPLSFIICTEPKHGKLTLDPKFNTNGRLFYTPEPHFTGADIFTFKLNDGKVSSTSAMVSINVIPNQSPVANPTSITIGEDMPVCISLTGIDPDSDPLTYTVVTDPFYGRLSGTAPALTYRPELNYNGQDSFTFKANDGKADSDKAMVSITVLSANDAPQANPQSKITKLNKSTSIILTGSDVDDDPLSFIICTEPEHGKLILEPNFGTSGKLTYRPEPGFEGPDVFTFKSNDGTLDSTPAMVSINVTPNQPPVANHNSVTTEEETPVMISLTGTDPESDQLTYNVVTGPSHGSLSGRAPAITYTPELNYDGPDSFTFKTRDGKSDSEKATISIKVLSTNDAPVAYPQSKATKVYKSISTTLTGSDVDDDPLSFIICTEPEHGTLTPEPNFSTSGKLTYMPKPDFKGSDVFTFKVNDDIVDSAPATVSISVTTNQPPVANPYSTTTEEDTPVVINLKGTDPDSDSLTYNIVMAPFNGSLSGTAPNLTYTPNKNFHGLDNFTFKVKDGLSDSAYATILITVSSINDPPTAVDDAVETQEDTPAVNINVLANDTDVDNVRRYMDLDTFRVTAVSQGANGSVTINPDGTLTYKPNANFSGSDVFTYTVSDDKGRSDTAKVNVTVNRVNDVPLITSEPVTTAAADELYTYDVHAMDPDVEDTLTYSLIIKPDNMTIDSATGLIQWKPTEAQIRTTEKVVVKVMDSNSNPVFDTQLFSIKVIPPPPKMVTLNILDGYNQRNRKTLSADGKSSIVQHSNNNRLETSFGSYISFDFSDLSIPAGAKIKSVVVRVEHFEEERFSDGKLEWTVGTGWPSKPAAWASIHASLHKGQSNEAKDSWDITGVADTREKVNSLQLQVKNNDNVARRKTFIDHVYVVVEWD